MQYGRAVIPMFLVIYANNLSSIDQSNIVERNQQVQHMKQIYALASRIIVWLGEDPSLQAKSACHDIEFITEVMCSRNSMNKTSFEAKGLDCSVTTEGLVWKSLPVAAWRDLHWFYSHTWFARLWVVQEVNAGPDVLVMCGKHTVPWTWVSLVAHTIRQMKELYTAYEFERSKCWEASAMSSTLLSTGYDWLWMLFLGKNFEVTDPRDHLYAMMGLPTFREQCPQLRVDYAKDTEHTFRDLAFMSIEQSRSLNILSFVQQEPVNGALSWVPRWNQK